MAIAYANEPTFRIDGVNFTDAMEMTGFGWEYNDIDDEESGRDHSTKMHRSVLGTKRKLTIKCVRLTFQRLHELCVAIHKPYIYVAYQDPEEGGVVEKQFYGTKLSSTVALRVGNDTWWDGTAFELVEV